MTSKSLVEFVNKVMNLFVILQNQCTTIREFDH